MDPCILGRRISIIQVFWIVGTCIFCSNNSCSCAYQATSVPSSVHISPVEKEHLLNLPSSVRQRWDQHAAPSHERSIMARTSTQCLGGAHTTTASEPRPCWICPSALRSGAIRLWDHDPWRNPWLLHEATSRTEPIKVGRCPIDTSGRSKPPDPTWSLTCIFTAPMAVMGCVDLLALINLLFPSHSPPFPPAYHLPCCDTCPRLLLSRDPDHPVGLEAKIEK